MHQGQFFKGSNQKDLKLFYPSSCVIIFGNDTPALIPKKGVIDAIHRERTKYKYSLLKTVVFKMERFCDSLTTADEMIYDVLPFDKLSRWWHYSVCPHSGADTLGRPCKNVIYVKLAWPNIKHSCFHCLFFIFTAETCFGSAVSSTENKLINRLELSFSDYISCSLGMYCIWHYCLENSCWQVWKD